MDSCSVRREPQRWEWHKPADTLHPSIICPDTLLEFEFLHHRESPYLRDWHCIMRSLANPETSKKNCLCGMLTKNMPMEADTFLNLFGHIPTPNTHPNTPRRRRRGVQGWYLGYCFKRFRKKSVRYHKQCVSKLHIGKFSKFQDLLRDAEYS